jgi:hypothetical protein
MATLFELTGEALTLQRQIDSAAELLFSDDPAEVAAATATLEGLISAESDNRKAVEAKADAWCWVIDQLRAQAKARADHADRLESLAAAAKHQAEVLQDRLIAALAKIDADATRWELPSHKITSRFTSSVQLDPDVEAASLPPSYVRVKTSYVADKVALAIDLKAGVEVPGAALVHRRSWSIK